MKHTHTVWYCRVSHRHGHNVYLGASEDEVMADLQDYVDENRGDFFNWLGQEDDDRALGIKDYFEVNEEEFWEVGSEDVTFTEGDEDKQEALIENLIREVMQNYPQASSGSLRCTRWRYKECVYEFDDVEEDEHYTVIYKDLREGFDILMKLAADKKFGIPGWNTDPVRSLDPGVWDDWAGDWDADVVDGLVQCAIFKDVIYG